MTEKMEALLSKIQSQLGTLQHHVEDKARARRATTASGFTTGCTDRKLQPLFHHGYKKTSAVGLALGLVASCSATFKNSSHAPSGSGKATFSPPLFYGDKGPTFVSWLFDFEQYCKTRGFSDEKCCSYAIECLKEFACCWFIDFNLKRIKHGSKRINSWIEFKLHLMNEFWGHERENYVSKFNVAQNDEGNFGSEIDANISLSAREFGSEICDEFIMCNTRTMGFVSSELGAEIPLYDISEYGSRNLDEIAVDSGRTVEPVAVHSEVLCDGALDLISCKIADYYDTFVVPEHPKIDGKKRIPQQFVSATIDTTIAPYTLREYTAYCNVFSSDVMSKKQLCGFVLHVECVCEVFKVKPGIGIERTHERVPGFSITSTNMMCVPEEHTLPSSVLVCESIMPQIKRIIAVNYGAVEPQRVHECAADWGEVAAVICATYLKQSLPELYCEDKRIYVLNSGFSEQNVVASVLNLHSKFAPNVLHSGEPKSIQKATVVPRFAAQRRHQEIAGGTEDFMSAQLHQGELNHVLNSEISGVNSEISGSCLKGLTLSKLRRKGSLQSDLRTANLETVILLCQQGSAIGSGAKKPDLVELLWQIECMTSIGVSESDFVRRHEHESRMKSDVSKQNSAASEGDLCTAKYNETWPGFARKCYLKSEISDFLYGISDLNVEGLPCQIMNLIKIYVLHKTVRKCTTGGTTLGTDLMSRIGKELALKFATLVCEFELS